MSLREIDDRKFSIIVPETDNSGNIIRKDELESVAKRMARQFGGSNIDGFIGCWKESPEEGADIMCEKNIMIDSIRDTEFRDHWTVDEDKDPKEQFEVDQKFLEDLREDIVDDFGQAVAFSSISKSESVTSTGDMEPTAEKSMLIKSTGGHKIDVSEHL